MNPKVKKGLVFFSIFTIIFGISFGNIFWFFTVNTRLIPDIRFKGIVLLLMVLNVPGTKTM